DSLSGFVQAHGTLRVRHQFDHHVERRILDAFLDARAPGGARADNTGHGHGRLVVYDGMYAPDEEVEFGILHEVSQRMTVRGGDQLHPAFGDRSHALRLRLRPDLVDDDNFGRVVL